MLEFLFSYPTNVFSIAIGAVVLFLVFELWQSSRVAKKETDAIARGIPATAKVIHVGHSESSSGGVDVNLTFEVAPPGGPIYKVKTIWSVEPLSVSKIQEGCTVALKIDANDPQKLYSMEDWAWALGQMPPDFTN
jgi:hypothetical protein